MRVGVGAHNINIQDLFVLDITGLLELAPGGLPHQQLVQHSVLDSGSTRWIDQSASPGKAQRNIFQRQK